MSDLSTKLGSWRNAPLIYVVAELSIAPHYGLAEKIPALQKELRSEYPRTVELSQISISPFLGGAAGLGQPNATPTAQPAWQLISSDNTSGIAINYRAIGLHATTYSNSTDFLIRWDRVLKAVEAAHLDVYVERAGLRYIDLIVPAEGHEPGEYLEANMLGPTLPGGSKVHHRMWSTAFSINEIAIQAHAFAPAPQGVLLPPTLAAIGLQMPAVLTAAQGLAQSGRSTGWIDTDVSRDVKQSFDSQMIGTAYRDLHKALSGTFKSFLSPRATEEWM
jgi:uncharacterized protein (TIGR04255 family)